MKRLWILPLLLLVSVANAEPTTLQEMKAWGFALDVTLEEVKAGKPTPETATLESVISFERRFCGHPERFDPELASSPLDVLVDTLGYPEDICQDIQLMHSRGEEARAKSWPRGCNPKWPNNSVVTYYVNRDSFVDFHKQPVSEDWLQGIVDAGVWGHTLQSARAKYGGMSLLDASLMLGIQDTYRLFGLGCFETQDRSSANVVISGKVIPGSVIGYAYYNNGTCDDQVTMVLDISWRPRRHGFARLIGHEFGHDNNLEHEFPGAQSTRAVMGYTPPDGDIYYGFSTGKAPHKLPLDPSVKYLVGYFGGKPFPDSVTPTPGPTPPPTGGVIPVGSELTVTIHATGQQLKLKVIGTQGDDGPSLGKRIIDALAAIPAYPKKEQDRQALAIIYDATGQAIKSGSMSAADGHSALKTLRGMLIGADATKWAGLFAIADTAPTAEGMAQVAGGLNGNAALSPEVIEIIKLVVKFLPEGRFKMILNLIMAIIGGFGNDEEPVVEQPADHPQPIRVSPPAAQKTGAIQPGDWTRFGNILFGTPIPAQPAVERKPVYTPARPIQTKFDADEARFGLVP